MAPSVSASGTLGFGQWMSRRSMASRARRRRLSSTEHEVARCKTGWFDLGGDDHLRAQTGRAHALPHLALVAVHLRAVDMAVADPYRLFDEARAVAPAQRPGAEPDGGNPEAFDFHRLHRGSAPQSRPGPVRRITAHPRPARAAD